MSLIQMTGIRKSYYGVEVLHGVDFNLKSGTVHALMGENGAGKSTLMKVLAGVIQPDSGEIMFDGKAVEIDSPSASLDMGIAMIHQELSPVNEMSVAENIFLGREPTTFGFVDYKTLYSKTETLLNELGIGINPKTKMKSLRVADQQMVEIAKAVSQNARVVIMDEPTSAITDREVESLFRMIGEMKKKGTGIIYISHKMDEIFRISDDITILRDGDYICTFQSKEVDSDTLIRSMVGRELTDQFPKTNVALGDPLLEVKNFSKKNQYENISFTLHSGEILGFVGLVGSGRTELMHSIFGMTQPDSGEMVLDGKSVRFKSPKKAIEHNIAYVTEDRKGEGLVLPMSIYQNTTLASLSRFSKNGLVRGKAEMGAVNEQVKALRVKTRNVYQPVKALSGGNQQKVVLSKWMITNPKVLILDEPTRGIDVGAKAEIYKIMCDFVAEGNAIIMVSSEMPEAMGMSDRIIVLSNHKYSGTLNREEFSQEEIVKLQFAHMRTNTTTQDRSE